MRPVSTATTVGARLLDLQIDNIKAIVFHTGNPPIGMTKTVYKRLPIVWQIRREPLTANRCNLSRSQLGYQMLLSTCCYFLGLVIC